jgi:hypothetical protein
MEIGIQGYDRPTLFACQLGDLRVAGATVADVGYVADIDSFLLEVSNGAARKALIQQ